MQVTQETDCFIRRETPADYSAVEDLTREAFWNVYRPGCSEHYIVHTLRQDPYFVPELDFVLEKSGQLIGHILYMRAHIKTDGGKTLPIMTFGPISIHPKFQRKGYGKFLLDYSMEQARILGAEALCIEGNPEFYSKSGFVLASSYGIRCHEMPEGEISPYFLLKELKDGFFHGVTGVYYTPKGYFVDETEVEQFDQAFPPKAKLHLPGQLV